MECEKHWTLADFYRLGGRVLVKKNRRVREAFGLPPIFYVLSVNLFAGLLCPALGCFGLRCCWWWWWCTAGVVGIVVLVVVVAVRCRKLIRMLS